MMVFRAELSANQKSPKQKKSRQPELLFVDDEDNIRLTLPLMLESEGFKVTSAATVAEALQLMSERQFDVLISDLNIGRAGDGFTVVSAMRNTQPNAIRFILTGYPDIESALRALREEVDDYLTKPTDIEEVVQKIRAKLQRRQRPKEVRQLRLSEIIKREHEYIIKKWLASAKEDADLRLVKLTDSERKNHLPIVLQSAIEILEGKEITSEIRKVAGQHGETRFKQGYLAPWLLREEKFLQQAIASCIQRNLLEIQISHLIPDIIRVFGIIQTLLEESLTAFLQQATRKASAH